MTAVPRVFRRSTKLCHAVTGVTLRHKDLRAVLAFLTDAHELDAPEQLTPELLDQLTDLIGCTYATFEAFDRPLRTVTAYVACSNEDPPSCPPFVAPERYWTGEHDPFLWTLRFDKWSDRVTRRERERIRDEEEFNAEFRVTDSIWLRVGNLHRRSACLKFDTQGCDFGDRERELARALLPHVDALWRRSVSRAQTNELVVAVARDGDGDAGQAIVLLAADGGVDDASPAARRLLGSWFGTEEGPLPPALEEWFVLARPGDRYTLRRNGTQLTVESAGEFTLTLTERRSDHPRLTPREFELLLLVAEGLTNIEIAEQLWISTGTVRRHLENAYRKLGVHTRTAAVARLGNVER